MTLPAWWNVATPRQEIRQGTFSESTFAADIAQVLKGSAPQEYLDPRLFFEKTYLTGGLKHLIRNVLNRMANGVGDAVIQLQTPFGGGKTHSLLTIYHLINSYYQVNHLAEIQNLANNLTLPDATVAVFVGTEADVIHGKTPWGEIAYQLGCYSLLKEHDQKRIAPGKELLREMIQQKGSVLILVDELLAYITKANEYEKQEKIRQGQTLVFLQELTEVIASSSNSVLILTLPKSDLEQFDEAATRALLQLEKIAGRVESIYVPVDGVEIYEVVRKRLFENLGDIHQHKTVAETYFRLYQQLGNDVPSEVREIRYRDKIEQAYPFHPELIDTLYERWGSFPNFQRTRGVLRLLADVIKDIYKKGSDPLIQSCHINLENPTLKRELVKHIGNEFDSIITSDITGKSKKIDQQMSSEYEKYSIASKLATAVFFYSFSGSDRRGVSLSWLRIALLNDIIPPMIVGDAIDKLTDSLWYFHENKRSYSFKNEPNLNRVIVDKEELIDDDQILDELKELCKDQPKGKLLEPHLWKEVKDIPDTQKLKLVILHPRYKMGENETNVLAEELLNPQSFRVYKNTVFLVIADESNYISLENRLKRYLALKAIAEDKDLQKTLSSSSKTALQDKLKDAEKDIVTLLVNTYCHVGWCDAQQMAFFNIGIATSGQDSSFLKRVEDFILNKRPITPKIKPELVLRGLRDTDNEKNLEDIYTNSLKIPGYKPLLASESVFLEAVKEGVKNGNFGLRIQDQLYYQQDCNEITLEGILVRAETAQVELTPPTPEADSSLYNIPYPSPTFTPSTAQENQPLTSYIPSSSTPSPREKTAQEKVKKVTFKVDVDWSKMSSLVRGVITPLQSNSTLKITLQVEAQSQEGYDRTTLDSKVKETLKQINAEILQWEEEQ